MKQNEMVAMILAGGCGIRLHDLTNKVAKPAVYYGGKYRIIDFPLSNCTNSGIDTVGVLTQYQPLELNAYIGSGAPWDLDRKRSRLAFLPPYTSYNGGGIPENRLEAIQNNLQYLKSLPYKYVLMSGCNYVANVDFTRALQQHVKKLTAPYKYPRIIEYVDELPKTVGGKIKRAQIRKADEDSFGRQAAK